MFYDSEKIVSNFHRLTDDVGVDVAIDQYSGPNLQGKPIEHVME